MNNSNYTISEINPKVEEVQAIGDTALVIVRRGGYTWVESYNRLHVQDKPVNKTLIEGVYYTFAHSTGLKVDKNYKPHVPKKKIKQTLTIA